MIVDDRLGDSDRELPARLPIYSWNRIHGLEPKQPFV